MNAKLMCRQCKQRFPRDGMAILPGGNFCTIEHAMLYGKSKAQATQKKAKAKQHREDKLKIKKLSEYIAEAQRAFNRYIRARDYFEPCISCGERRVQLEITSGWLGGIFDAGHYKSRGAAPHLKFNLHNCHGQCKKCNGGSGKFAHKEASVGKQYRISLIGKIGIDKVEALESNQEIRKFSKEYCERIKKIFNKKARIQERRNDVIEN